MSSRVTLARTAAALSWAASLAVSGCNVTPLGVEDRGAVVDGRPGCPGAALVVLSDYLSTQIALVSLEGETLSESLISTASLEGSPLSFPLSGDVTLPSSRPPSGRAVISGLKSEQAGEAALRYVNAQPIDWSVQHPEFSKLPGNFRATLLFIRDSPEVPTDAQIRKFGL